MESEYNCQVLELVDLSILLSRLSFYSILMHLIIPSEYQLVDFACIPFACISTKAHCR